MDKKKIIREYKKKITLLKKYDEFYYEKSNPLISDKEYDELKKQILKIEIEAKVIKSKNSPSEKVGYKPSKNFQKVSHRVPRVQFLFPKE